MAQEDKEEKSNRYKLAEMDLVNGHSMEFLRNNFDILELSRRVKKKGDLLIISQELKVTPNVLKHIKDEAIILEKFPNLHKSKTNALIRLKTDRDRANFFQSNDFYKLSARQLYKAVKEWNSQIQIKPHLFISEEEHNLIIGSLLGDSSIRQRDKYSCLRFSHSLKQKEYAQWKMNKLSVFPVSEFREVQRKINDHFIYAVDFSTRTHPVFNYYRNLFYKNGIKTITQELLDEITNQSLAIWVCDDGSYSSNQGYIILCTNAFSLEEHQLMKKMFNEKFGINPFIGFRDGKYHYLRFNKADSQRLINIIKPFIPDCMSYKIGVQKNG